MPLILRKTIGQTFMARVQSSPTRPGFRFRPTFSEMGDPIPTLPGGKPAWTELNYRQFYDRARLISFGLVSLGIKPGDKVALLSETRIEWEICDIAILGARAVTVPIYPSNPASEVEFILTDSGSQTAIIENTEQLEKVLGVLEASPERLPSLKHIILIDPTAMHRLARHGGASKRRARNILTLQALKELGRREEGRDPKLFDENLTKASPTEVITLCYTTGTTGRPKGVLLTHENMISVLEDCVDRMGKRLRPEEETLLTFLPLAHVLGKLESMAVWTLGGLQAFSRDSSSLSNDLLEVKPTLLFAVPRIFEKAYNLIYSTLRETQGPKRKLYEWAEGVGAARYAKQLKKDKPGLILETQYQLARKLVFSRVSGIFGGRLRYAICGGAALSQKVGQFFEITGIRILEGYGLTETCGAVTLNDPDRPRYGTVGKPLRNVHIRIAPDGEILIRSKQLFQGYHNLQEETNRALEGDWFHTGDVGSIDSGGFLRITDRQKDILVLSSGKNVAPQKIENIAVNNPLIRECVVLGEGRSFVSALVILNQELVVARANEHNILFSEYAELIKNSKVISWVESLVGEINQQLAHFERIQKFVILPEEFKIERGELTPSLKVRRKVIQKKYQTELDRLYDS